MSSMETASAGTYAATTIALRVAAEIEGLILAESTASSVSRATSNARLPFTLTLRRGKAGCATLACARNDADDD